MKRTRTIMIAAATAACLIAAVAWAATPKGPGPVNLNPNVGSMNPSGATMPNPNVGSMNPTGATMPNPGSKPTPPAATQVVSPPFVFRPGGFRPFQPYQPYQPYGGYGYGSTYRYPRYYVVAEKRGADVTWSTYEWTNQVYARLTQLQSEKNATVAANNALAKEIVALKAQAAALQKAIAAETDDAAKAELMTKLAAVEKLLAEKEAAVRPVARWVARGPMDPRNLQDFVSQLQREAYAAQLKAGVAPSVPTPNMPARGNGY